MGETLAAGVVKLFCGILTAFPERMPEVEECLIREFGPIDLRSEVSGFEHTSYYEDEMGKGIKRKFVAFEKEIAPDVIASIKLRTNVLEKEIASKWSVGVERPVNLDPGYVTLGKLVLATTKDRDHRVYLGNGIYAESTLRFEKGSFRPWLWTYPDYQMKEHIRFFNEVRKLVLRSRIPGRDSNAEID